VTWVFELRRGVTFHDGRPLTAADVVATFERLKKPGSLQMAANVREIASVRALDPMRIEVRTERPQPILLNRLSLIAILPGGTADPRRPIGTGPYRFASWDEGGVHMSANATYWGGRPALPDVTLRLAQTPEAAERDLRAGDVQLGILASQEIAARLTGDASLRVLRRTGMFLKFLGFDLGSEAFRDPRVRQAVSLAIDRGRLVSRLVEPAVPAYQLVPPTVFGFDPELPELHADLDKARALLRGAGFPGGFDVTLDVRRAAGSGGPPVAQMLAPLGIRAKVVLHGEAEFAGRTGAAAFYLNRFGCETGDASDMLTAAMSSTNGAIFGAAAPGDAAAAFEKALKTGMESDQPELRGAALMQIMAAGMRMLPVVPLYFDEDAYGVRKGVEWRPRADGYLLAAEVREARSAP
jgi:peptide/nickel transport system substrate-binding protein